MHAYLAEVRWERAGQTFTDLRYSRAHSWAFDGGARVHAAASPHIVPLPYTDATGVDPEEALVAAASSCHMLVFLGLAAKAGWIIDSYRDAAEGLMEKRADGKQAMTRITLRPQIAFHGAAPDAAALAALHHAAHEECYIANSIRAEIVVEGC